VRFELTHTQRDIQKAAREFAEKEFDLDLALELEKEGRFPKPIFEKACQLGFIGIDYPEQYGGQSFGLFENVLVVEEFTRKDSGIGISLSMADMGSSIILKHGDESQKMNFLVPVTQRKAISTVAIIDSSHGKNQEPLITKAEAHPNGYVINEGKAWVIHGSLAQTIVVLCETHDPKKPIALIVEGDWGGVNILGLKKVMGMKISPICEIAFDHVKVPKDHVIHWENGETDPLTTYRHVHRIKTSAQALGIAQGAFDLAVRHAREREQFGRRIIQFQGIQFMMAELYTLIEASRNLVYRAACSYDSQSSDLDRISSVAKLFATDVAVKTAIDSIQIHGGVGLMKEYSIERMLRDAKTIQNLEETNLVQKALIAKKIIS
jgi:alkylation response protein AidB-like acyl-CoA dehydrogenase